MEPENNGFPKFGLIFLFQGLIFRFHVKFRGCINYVPRNQKWSPLEKEKHLQNIVFWVPAVSFEGVSRHEPRSHTSKQKILNMLGGLSQNFTDENPKEKTNPTFFKPMALFPTFWEVCMCLKIMSSKIHPFKHSTTNIIQINQSFLFGSFCCIKPCLVGG